MPSKREHTFLLAAGLAFFDTACIASAFLLAALFTVPADESFMAHAGARLQYVFVLVVIWCFQAIDQRLFVSRRSDALMPQLFTVTKAIFVSLVLMIFVLALLKTQGIDRRFVVIFCGFTLLTMVFLRTLIRLSLWGLRRRGYNYRRILVIGANPRTAHVAEVILSHEHYGFQIFGYLEDDPERKQYLERYRIPYYGKVQDLERLLTEEVVDLVYISLPVRSHYETIQSIAHLCEGVGVPVRLIADLFPLRIATSELLKIADIPLLALSKTRDIQAQQTLKRVTDIMVSSILLLMMAPVFAGIAILIRLDSRGPVLMVERRTTADDKPFSLFRFRTLRVTQSGEAPVWGGANGSDHHVLSPDDPSVTRVGRTLLLYGLDELPQLLNILLGHVSLMEPRSRMASDSGQPLST